MLNYFFFLGSKSFCWAFASRAFFRHFLSPILSPALSIPCEKDFPRPFCTQPSRRDFLISTNTFLLKIHKIFHFPHTHHIGWEFGTKRLFRSSVRISSEEKKKKKQAGKSVHNFSVAQFLQRDIFRVFEIKVFKSALFSSFRITRRKRKRSVRGINRDWREWEQAQRITCVI